MNHTHHETRSAPLMRLTLGLLLCALALVPAQAQKRHTRHGVAKTTKKAATARQSKPADVAYYSCPMHASVKEKSAGRCPKCGMDLRPVSHADAREAEASANDAGASGPNAATATNATTAADAETSTGQVARMNIPDTELLDQDGRKVRFYTDLVKGKTVAINFIFTTCTTICPPLGATFARVQKEMGERAGKDVRFISISVDPATDTPERLKAWAAKFRAGESWTLLTGNKPEVDELLRVLGASSARREDHSPTILIGNDARGTWTRTYGLAKPSRLVQIINDAIDGTTAADAAEGTNQ
ncbi:MAG TPA: SCO family protein [Pyrinomonadaceae bacterium]|nr:SCO family protein [Pyrinomonadaceae bacterium]